MDATEWNLRCPVGTDVVVTLADGRRVQTRTASIAATWGGLSHVQVEAINGFVLLGWVRPGNLGNDSDPKFREGM